jgi:hypothetical protein
LLLASATRRSNEREEQGYPGTETAFDV